MKDWGLKFLRKLNPAKWMFKAPLNDGKTHFGLIAQDVDKVASRFDYGFVGFKKGFLTINYEEFIGPMIKGILELDIENIKLKKRVQKLEEQNASEISTNSHR